MNQTYKKVKRYCINVQKVKDNESNMLTLKYNVSKLKERIVDGLELQGCSIPLNRMRFLKFSLYISLLHPESMHSTF